MTLSRFISLLTKLTRLLRDVNAVRRGRVAQRVYNRTVGSIVARGMRRVWR